jgi:hypothetical protein
MSASAQPLRVRVAQKRPLAQDIVLFELVSADGGPLFLPCCSRSKTPLPILDL